ncbi:LLM class flavin-dependent oxidoreductase [Brachybacterium sp. EF45031]|uniref:LLM class flavin-dependent oxidoreductase n=1 Tax=Brachybacterium sillae TaxID=2810536 RepID=UPI00217DAF09|nr:LLM class flavin-dependent oxidoreductase [Brachybacterium sillae]MCS6711431.1 LLM class flavin-dependent oxidoreductase [Brachybacterium sillae]
MSSVRVPLSILDVVPIAEGTTAARAIADSVAAAQAADRLGYERFWYAEHHNAVNLAATATSVLIAHAAARTERIRVGSGGVMIPNHAPLAVIEQFGTLVQIHGDRIDLGLGRAPGTDPLTAQLLSRTAADPEAFMEAVRLMQAWSAPADQERTLRIQAPVAEGTQVPMWVLGSTVNGARLAARLGLPFAVASHFAPDQLFQALELYRREFTADAPTAQIREPRTMVAVNVVVADTDEQARRLFTTGQQAFAGIITGQRRLAQPPVDDITTVVPEPVLQRVEHATSVRAVGSPDTVTAQLERLVEQTRADELILSGTFVDVADRLRSLELLARAWGLPGAVSAAG